MFWSKRKKLDRTVLYISMQFIFLALTDIRALHSIKHSETVLGLLLLTPPSPYLSLTSYLSNAEGSSLDLGRLDEPS